MTATPHSSPVPAVRVERVEKKFRRRRAIAEVVRRPFARRKWIHALRGVSFSVAEGQLVGLLGPNGAGKTTLLKVLCGLVLPDQGRAEVRGVKAGTSELPRMLGLVHGDERSFYWRLTARENLTFFARLHQLPRAGRRQRVDELLARVGLSGDADRRFADFSSGMRQKLAIARALLADPPVLLMDEPTRSLDPVSAGEQREWIKSELHARLGKTILIATHNLREAEVLCDRVVVIAEGEIRADGAPEELRRWGLGGVVYRLRVRGGAPEAMRAGQTLSSNVGEDGVRDLVVRLPDDEALDSLLQEIRVGGGKLIGCAPETPDLETVFRQLVGRAPVQRAS